jgi:hypothetical protein
MIGDTMLFGRPPQPHPRQLVLSEVVQSVLSKLADQAADRQCRFEVRLEPEVRIWADETQLNVVVSSLLQNSLDALRNGGTITVSTVNLLDTSGEWACLSIGDNGPGLSEIDRAHLFDPFYSGRQAGRGLGFGLSKCWRIVDNHGGSIEVVSIPNESTTFFVRWPATSGSLDDTRQGG